MHIKQKKFLLGIVAGVFILFLGALFYAKNIKYSKCVTENTFLPEYAPPEFIAVFDIDCASTYPGIEKEEMIDFAITFGYPSLLFDIKTEREVLSLIESTVREGDRGFFASDPNILAELKSRAAHYHLNDEIAFVEAIINPKTRFEQNNIDYAFLMALPLWENLENMKRLSDWCSVRGCEISKTECDTDVGLEDKLAIARGDISFETVYAKCPLSFEWLKTLRRVDLIDTMCSSTRQINHIMNKPEAIGEPCFSATGDSLDSYRGDSPSTVVRFLRFLYRRENAISLSDIEIDYIRNYYTGVPNPHMGMQKVFLRIANFLEDSRKVNDRSD